jgi:glycopeptide antibiotics resistance protein
MDIPIKNLLGNLLLFLPMGIYLPYIFKKLYIFRNYFKYITLFLISIEIMQLILRRGSFDIDDFILNIIGAIIGFAIGKVKGIKYLMKGYLT